MTDDLQKAELIDWIKKLNDPRTIKRLLALKKEEGEAGKQQAKSKIFGSGKHLIKHVDEDFNEPLDMFKPYEK